MATQYSRKVRIIVLLCVVMAVSFAVVLYYTVRIEKEVLTVAFLDVGQGDAIFIETPHGNQMLIDGGKGRAVLRALNTRMPFFDRSIDVVLATHPDFDHIGGLPEVFRRFDVGMFLVSGVEDTGDDIETLTHAVHEAGTKTVSVRDTMYINLDTDVTVDVLFPDREVTHLEVNTASVIVKLTYKDTTFLFTGDAPAGIETYLAGRYKEQLASDVLKLGHHGSNTSSANVFLGYVDPSYAIISAGCDNQYGHPHTEVLERLAQFSIAPLSTCKEGTIVFESDGTTVTRQ